MDDAARDQSPDLDLLRDEFDNASWAHHAAMKAVGCRPARYHQMLLEHGGLEAARFAIGHGSSSFHALLCRGRLDLTVEALILQPCWRPLFTEAEKKRAFNHLQRFGYQPPSLG